MATLYRRDSCELCDHAERALADAGVSAYERVTIGWEGALAERYGERIPVLVRDDTGDELGWPFDATAVRRFLA